MSLTLGLRKRLLQKLFRICASVYGCWISKPSAPFTVFLSFSGWCIIGRSFSLTDSSQIKKRAMGKGHCLANEALNWIRPLVGDVQSLIWYPSGFTGICAPSRCKKDHYIYSSLSYAKAMLILILTCFLLCAYNSWYMWPDHRLERLRLCTDLSCSFLP